MSTLWDASWRDIWKNRKFRPLSAEAKLVYWYTYNNDGTTAAGIYPLDFSEIVNWTNLGLDKVDQAINELCDANLIKYCRKTEIIWVIGKWDRSPIQSSNHKIRIGTEFVVSSGYSFWREFFDRYPEIPTHLLRAKRYKNQQRFKYLYEVLTASTDDNPCRGLEISEVKGRDYVSLPFPSPPRDDQPADTSPGPLAGPATVGFENFTEEDDMTIPETPISDSLDIWKAHLSRLSTIHARGGNKLSRGEKQLLAEKMREADRKISELKPPPDLQTIEPVFKTLALEPTTDHPEQPPPPYDDLDRPPDPEEAPQ